VSRVRRVLVVGAGIPGMSLAAALKKAGTSLDIIEIQPQWDVLGVGISVQGPALRALKTIGLIDHCVREPSALSKTDPFLLV
jgi:2-polyprenyl-6-methoxyphenol hydroxylase-like FAD-dependent oxidoreductase